MTRATDLDFLREVVLFKELAEPHLAALASQFQERRLRQGGVLFREGDPGQELYVIREGRVIVSKGVTGRVEQVLARLGAAELFGEMSLFDQAPRSATVQAETEVVLLCLDRENLHQLIEVNPQAAAVFFYRLVQVFIRRLRETDNMVAEVTRWGLEATGLDVADNFPA